MTMAIVGVVLNFFMSLFMLSVGDDPYASSSEVAIYPIAGAIGLCSCALAVLGLILAKTQETPKVGSILIIVGSVMFVPLGMIAIFGALKMTKPYDQKIADDAFERRRQVHLKKQKRLHSENAENLGSSGQSENSGKDHA